MDPRHRERIKIVQELFSSSFANQPGKSTRTLSIIEKKLYLDEHIQKIAPKFPLKKIAKIDLCILELATYELLIEKKEPYKVIINEAVELARELGGEKTYSFVNAVLGKIYAKSNQSV